MDGKPLTAAELAHAGLEGALLMARAAGTAIWVRERFCRSIQTKTRL